ncbi:MAG: hypothetical protein ACRDXX_16280 [Stackebrandtia sp.]
MNDSSGHVEGELWNLYLAGRRDLPTMAAAFATTNNKVHHAGSAAGSVFVERLSGTTLGSDWSEAQASIMAVLTETSNILRDVGVALESAATEYGNADTAGAAGFRKIRDGNTIDDVRPPIPDTKKPGDPTE